MWWRNKKTGKVWDVNSPDVIRRLEKDTDYEATEAPEEASPKTPDPMKDWPVEQLLAFAAERNISVGNATTASGVLKRIRAVIPLEDLGDGS